MKSSQSLTIKAFLAALSQLDESRVADLPPELQQFDWVQDTERLDRLARDSILATDYQSARKQLTGGPVERSKSALSLPPPEDPEDLSAEIPNLVSPALDLSGATAAADRLNNNDLQQVNTLARQSSSLANFKAKLGGFLGRFLGDA